MRFLSVLLSLILCCSAIAFAQPVQEGVEMGVQPPMGGSVGFTGEMPQMPQGEGFPAGDFQPSQFNGGGVPPFGGEVPAEFPGGNIQNFPTNTEQTNLPENTADEVASQNDAQPSPTPAEETLQPNNANGEFSANNSKRPQFPGMGEGGFQPPKGGNFPDFGGRGNPWGQNAEVQEAADLSLFLTKYQVALFSLGVLLVCFVFVGLYRRRHY